MKWYVLRWATYWADLWNGLVGVMTFGFWDASVLKLKVQSAFLDYHNVRRTQ